MYTPITQESQADRQPSDGEESPSTKETKIPDSGALFAHPTRNDGRYCYSSKEKSTIDSGISTDSSTHKYPECYRKKEKTDSDITKPMDTFIPNRIATIEVKIAHLTNFLAMNKNLEVVIETELNQIRAELVRLKFPVNTY